MAANAEETERQRMEIKRVGPPTTRNLTDWNVALSNTPDGEWQTAFMHAGEHSAIAVPRRVVFDWAAIVFKSNEDQVPHWVEYIDKWIDEANRTYAARLEADQRRRQHTAEGGRQIADRAREATERFKNL
jgi:hypothetical protein